LMFSCSVVQDRGLIKCATCQFLKYFCNSKSHRVSKTQNFEFRVNLRSKVKDWLKWLCERSAGFVASVEGTKSVLKGCIGLEPEGELDLVAMKSHTCVA